MFVAFFAPRRFAARRKIGLFFLQTGRIRRFGFNARSSFAAYRSSKNCFEKFRVFCMVQADSEKKLVMPGDAIAFSEEFASSDGTFEEKDGRVIASRLGRSRLDPKGRTASVYSLRATIPLKAGDLVYGKVQDLYDTVALVQFEPVPEKGVFRAASNTYAYLRISEVQRGFVENFRDVVRIGDFVRARIKEVTKMGIYLTMMAPDLGVVKACCSNCRKTLSFRGRILVCPHCGSKEERKTAQNGPQESA